MKTTNLPAGRNTLSHFSQFLAKCTAFSVLLFVSLGNAQAKTDLKGNVNQLGNVNAQASVDLYTGTSNYAYPIVTPSGTNGMGPKLLLRYNSDGGDGWVGKGWSLTGLGEIERRGPNYGSAPGWDASDTFMLKMNGNSKLVYTGTDPSGTAGNYYRTQIASFRRIEYVSASNYWVVTDTDGTQYFFGRNTDSLDTQKVCNYNKYPVVCTTGTLHWYLDKVMDTHGVFWTVSYGNERNNGGDVYPKQIVYSQGIRLGCTPDNLSVCRIVDFSLTSRANKPIETSFAGTPIVEDKLLDTITISLGGQIIRSYKLGYDFSSSAPSRDRAPDYVLSSVTEFGADGSSALPPTKFFYNYGEPLLAPPNSLGVYWNGAPNYLPWGPGAQPQVGGNPTGGGTACNYFIDMNNDGYPDLLMGKPGAWTYVDKPGDTWLESSIPNPAGSQLPSLCATTTRSIKHVHVRSHKWYQFWRAFKTDTTYETVQVPLSNVIVIDIDGDGFPDIVDGTNGGQWYWYRNNGDSPITFSARMPIAGSPGFALSDQDMKIPYNNLSTIPLPHRSVRFADMDGDGLVDIFQAHKQFEDRSNASYWRLTWRRNLGDGNFAAPITMMPVTGGTYGIANTTYEFRLCYGVNFNTKQCEMMFDNSTGRYAPPYDPNDLVLVDINGDGLLDLVWQLYTVEKSGQINFDTLGIHYEVIYNQGGGKIFRYPVKGDMAVTVTGTHSLPQDAKLSPSVYWIDMNGDNLPDLLVGTAGNYRYYPMRYQDGDLDPPITLTNPPTEFGSHPPKYLALTRENYITITDFDGDGLPDFVLTPPMAIYGIYGVENSVELGLFHKLTGVQNSLGGVTSFDYQLLHSGNTIKWVSKDIKINDGVGDPAQVESYSFSGGKNVGWPNFESRGYSNAVVTDAAGVQSSTTFFQDDARKGLIQQSSKDTRSYSYTYETSEPVPGVTRVDLASHTVTTSSAAGAKSISTTYDHYDDYGNPIQLTTSGDDIATRVTTTNYVVNTTDAYIVNRPYRTDTRIDSPTGNKISETWYMYDGFAASVYAGDLTRETHWNSTGDNTITQYAYDDYGNRIGTIDPKQNTCAATGYTNAVTYDVTYQTFPVTTTNALCQNVTTAYWGINATLDVTSVADAYDVPGLVASVTDVNNVRSDSYWDVFGRARANVVPPDSAAAPTTTTSYSLLIRSSSISTPRPPSAIYVSRNTGNGVLNTETIIDGLGRTIQTKSESATPGEWITQDTFYNNRALVESVTVPYVTTSSDYTDRSTTQTKTITLYDGLHRPIQETNTDGTFKTTAYDLWDVTSTDENGNATTRSYDALNRLIKVIEPGGGTTTYRYDYYGTSPTSGSLGHNFQYINDALGNLISAPEFDTLGNQVADYDPDHSYHSYTYDANGNMLTQSDARVQKLTFTYDKLNRIKTKTYPDGKVITYYYDDTTAGKYRVGRLWKVTDLSGSTIFSYDQRGRRVQEDKAIGGRTFTNKTTYDSLDRVTTMTYPDGEVVQNSYDARGLLANVHSNTYNLDYLANSTYNPMGKVSSRTYGNGLVTSYDYYDDPSKGPTSYRLLGIATPGLQNLNYIYDDVGNIREIADYVHVETQDFDYDNLNRLTSARSFPIFQPLATTSGTSAPAFEYTFTYDAIGNMLTGEGKTFTYPTPGAMRPHAPLTSTSWCSSFAYDNNGNQTSSLCGGVTKTYSWDYDNLLTKVTNGTTVMGQYTYDYAGNRMKKVEGGVTRLMPFPNYRIIGRAATKYYFANGQRIAERTGGTSSTNVYYYHPDHLGSSNVVTDSAGIAVRTTLFSPYGNWRAETGNKPIEQKYNGKDFDEWTELYNYGARYYDRNLMHFISADSTVPNLADPQMFNRYAYTRNNPVKLVDPTGHSPEGASENSMSRTQAVETVRWLPYDYKLPFIYSITDPDIRGPVVKKAFLDVVRLRGPHPYFGKYADYQEVKQMMKDPSLIYRPYQPVGPPDLAAAKRTLGPIEWEVSETAEKVKIGAGLIKPLSPIVTTVVGVEADYVAISWMNMAQRDAPIPTPQYYGKVYDWALGAVAGEAFEYPYGAFIALEVWVNHPGEAMGEYLSEPSNGGYYVDYYGGGYTENGYSCGW